jgi:hypothetical protein
MFKRIAGVLGALVAVLYAGAAYATPWIDVSSIDVDTAPVATLGLTIITALAAMWVLRKLIKTTNKS